MAQAFRIETLDRSGRWYLTPGARSIYDLQVRNDSNHSADCSLVVEDPLSGATVNPQTFSLRGHEVRTVTVTFTADAHPTRSQRVYITLRDGAGSVLATFEHPLIIAGSTDCSVSLAWKDAIVESGGLRGFEMTCTVRSQSEAPSSFPITFTGHPALAVPDLPPVYLEPGQASELVIPVRWDRSVRDNDGNNHPVMLEASVPVSNGRRTSRVRWETIESKLQSTTKPQPLLDQAEPQPSPAEVEPQPSPVKPESQFAWNDVIAIVQRSATPPNLDAIGSLGISEAASTAQPEPGAASKPHIAYQLGDQIAVEKLPPANAVELPLFQDLVRESTAPTPSTQSVQPAATQSPSAAVAAATAAARAAADAELDAVLAPQTNSKETIQSEPAPAKLLPAYQTIGRKRFAPPPRAGFLIGGLVIVALVVAGVLFKPTATSQAPSTSPVAVSAPGVAANPAVLAAALQPHAARKPAAQHRAPVAHKTAATPAPQLVAQPAATPQPAALKPAPHQPVAHRAAPAVASQQSGPAHAFQHVRLYQPETAGAVVALAGIEAFYGPRGRAVRVIWSAAEQASANVQLIDDHGTTVNSVTVHGARQAVTMYLPRHFRGPLTVEVSSVGRIGERVAETTSLPAFGE